MRSRFIEVDDPEWTDVLAETQHDIYHLPAYVGWSAERDAGKAVAFLAQDHGHQFFVPMIIRPIDPGLIGHGPPLFDATCTRGFPGPLLSRSQGNDGEDQFLSRALGAFVSGLKQQDVVACFLRLHPLFIPSLSPMREIGILVHHDDTVAIDLTLTMDDLWRQTRHGHRQDINRAKRLGHSARIDIHWDMFDEFFVIYQETMQRVGAAKHWHLSRGYFLELREVLGDRLLLCVVDIEGDLAAAGLFTEIHGLVEYHLGGSRTSFFRHHPAKLMIDFMRSWAKQRGNTMLHLGGSPQRGDALFHFKRGFSPLVQPVLSWRVVIDSLTYRRLVERWEANYHVLADSAEGFFPAYRRVP